MSKSKDVGVYQKKNGYWEYRFTMVVGGSKISKKKGTDEFGNKLKTKKEAVNARAAAMAAARNERSYIKPVIRKTLKEVFEEMTKPIKQSENRIHYGKTICQFNSGKDLLMK